MKIIGCILIGIHTALLGFPIILGKTSKEFEKKYDNLLNDSLNHAQAMNANQLKLWLKS